MAGKEDAHKTSNNKNTSKIVAVVCVIIILVAGAVLIFRGNSAAPSNGALNPSLYVSPDSQSVGKNQEIKVSVWADSTDQKVSTVEADIKYPADTFDVVKVDAAKSSFQVSLPVKQSEGYVSIVRGSTTPLKGTLLVAVLTLQSKDKTGTGSLTFTEDSKLFATGQTKSILAETKNGKFTVK